jgi:hypothetical protein
MRFMKYEYILKANGQTCNNVGLTVRFLLLSSLSTPAQSSTVAIDVGLDSIGENNP